MSPQQQQMLNLLSPSYRLEEFDDHDEDETPFLDLTDTQLESLSFSFEEGEEGSDNSAYHNNLPERKISFSDSLEEVFEITPILRSSDSIDDDDDDDDLCQLLLHDNNDIWYKNSEMKIFRRQRDALSKRLQLQQHKSARRFDDEDCIEGLETACRDKVKSVVKAVLSEQERSIQQELSDTSSDGDDPLEYLSCISRSLSSLSVEEAVNRGLRLQHDIVDSYDNNSNNINRR